MDLLGAYDSDASSDEEEEVASPVPAAAPKTTSEPGDKPGVRKVKLGALLPPPKHVEGDKGEAEPLWKRLKKSSAGSAKGGGLAALLPKPKNEGKSTAAVASAAALPKPKPKPAAHPVEDADADGKEAKPKAAPVKPRGKVRRAIAQPFHTAQPKSVAAPQASPVTAGNNAPRATAPAPAPAPAPSVPTYGSVPRPSASLYAPAPRPSTHVPPGVPSAAYALPGIQSMPVYAPAAKQAIVPEADPSYMDRHLRRDLAAGRFDSAVDQIQEITMADIRGQWDPTSVEDPAKKRVFIKGKAWSSQAGEMVNTSNVSRTQKRKHQINALAYQAKEMEAELALRRAAGRKTKGQTMARYGW